MAILRLEPCDTFEDVVAADGVRLAAPPCPLGV
jgi:hypothetical protein